MVVYGVNVETGRNYQAEQSAIVSGLSREVYNRIRKEQHK